MFLLCKSGKVSLIFQKQIEYLKLFCKSFAINKHAILFKLYWEMKCFYFLYFILILENVVKTSIWIVFGSPFPPKHGSWPIKCQCCPRIETSQLVCFTNQLTGFYKRATLAFSGLILRASICSGFSHWLTKAKKFVEIDSWFNF